MAQLNGFQSNGSQPNGVTEDESVSDFRKPSEKLAKLLDVINELRILDVDHELELPQLVVCGEQSSGKSSVLEAISRIPFPRAGTTCTRFVTQISLRPPERDGEVGIRVQVRPRHSTAPLQHTFDEKLDSLDGLAELIERASDFMGLGPSSHAVHGNGVSAPVARFSRDILSIEVRQEGYQPLTLVDLPGIIQSGKKQQNESESDKKMVNSIVNEWVKDPRTIILAVMDATRDIESHSILEKAMKAKQWEYRTLGIITKPDIPQKFEASQRSWVKIALNEHEDYSFRQGWHVLMNRDERNLRVASTSSERDEMERSFLSNPENGWSEVVDRSAMQIRNNVKPRTCGWGVEQLKARLYELLEDQTYRYLPEIRNSVQIKIQQLEAQLDKLGFKESTPQQVQKRFLLLCAEMADMTKHGMEGNYDRRFKLSNWHLEKGRLSLGHVSKLRNNIRDHDLKFAKLIRSNGHDTFFAPACDSTSVEQSDWIGKVATILEKTKGEELQTHVDPKRIGLFFWDYSKGWEKIALGHIQAISDECEKFLRWVVQSTLEDIFPSLADTLFNMHVRPKLKRRFNEARQELAKLEFDRERAPRTENPDFVTHSLRAKNRNVWRIVMQALDERNKDALDPDLWESPEYLAKATKLASMSDRQDQEAAQFMTDMLIYYRIARNRFIDEVLIHVVERHLVDDMQKLFNELIWNEDNCLDDIFAQEGFKDLQRQYEELSAQKEKLERLSKKLVLG